MQPISRRRALQLAGLGLAAATAGGVVLTRTAGSSFGPGGDELREPSVLRSADGLLQVRLEAARGPVSVAGTTATALHYNGGLPGPTLRVRPGDRVGIDLVNRLDQHTNLHVHGMHVSPQDNGDNAFVVVEPGRTFTYDHRLPPTHPPGVYWYHPHHHGTVADQVFGGLYGAIVVDDPEPLPVARERILVVSDITLDGAGTVQQPSLMEQMTGREGQLVLVNGQTRPRLLARPGERERWRIVNACVARYLRLRLDGQRMQLLGVDSGRSPAPQDVEEIVLTTGNRADLLVTAGAGRSELRTLPYDRGRAAMMGGGARPGPRSATGDPVVLATLDVTGPAVPPLPAPPVGPAPRDLRGEPVAATRTLTFGMDMGAGMGMGGGMRFTIDGRSFDLDRIDHVTRIGSVEEWTLVNTSPMNHPLHLHVHPMQVVTSADGALRTPVWRDVVDVPARGRVTVRVAFDDFPGRTVYHCHILDHEDRGMMGVIEAG